MKRHECVCQIEESIELHAHLNTQSCFDDRGIGQSFRHENLARRTSIAFAEQTDQRAVLGIRKKTFATKKLAQRRRFR